MIFASNVRTEDSLCRKILPFLSFQISQEMSNKSDRIVLGDSSVEALATFHHWAVLSQVSHEGIFAVAVGTLPQARSKDVWCNDIVQINAELTCPYVYIADTSSGSATPSVQADLQSTTGSGRLAKRIFYILVAPTLSISTDPDSCPWHPKIEPCTLI